MPLFKINDDDLIRTEIKVKPRRAQRRKVKKA